MMTSQQKIDLAIPAFLMALIGDYLIGYEPWNVEPLGLIADTGWLTIADWRIAVSNILGAIAVPMCFAAAKEFLRLLFIYIYPYSLWTLNFAVQCSI